MDVFVVVMVCVITGITGGIIHHAVYVYNLMDQTVVEQTVQYPVNRYPVTQAVQFVLNSRLRQRHIGVVNEFQYRAPGSGIPSCLHRDFQDNKSKKFNRLAFQVTCFL
jgi:hypothetical protein